MEDSKSKETVLLVNTGSPDSNSLKDVQRFVSNLLMDKHVISIPYPLRLLLVRGIILPLRAKRSCQRYQSIWDASIGMMPLSKYSHEIADKLCEGSIDCRAAMRYSKPSAFEQLSSVTDLAEKTLCIFPLFPQYTSSTYQSVSEFALKAAKKLGVKKIKLVPPFYKHPAYIEAMAATIQPYLEQPFDKILFSFHSIPSSHLHKSCRKAQSQCCQAESERAKDCYRHQCQTSFELICRSLGIEDGKRELLYQSQMRGSRWIGPFLADRLKELPQEGCKRVLVCCPSFICDCLESLVEVAEEAKAVFLTHGGEEFTYIPCLNSSETWISAMKEIIKTAE